jgi:hypothetical protein
VRLDTYRFTDAGMHGALDRLITNGAPRERLASAGQEIRARDGVAQAAGLIEGAARD